MVRRLIRSFQRQVKGVAALEAALIAPVLIIAGFAVIDAAYLMLTVHRIETGLNAGATYLARSRAPTDELAAAQNIAVKGNPEGTGKTLVDGWATSDVTATVRSVANDGGENGKDTVLRGGDTIYVIRMSTIYRYQGLGLLKMVGLGELDIQGDHEERAFGMRS